MSLVEFLKDHLLGLSFFNDFLTFFNINDFFLCLSKTSCGHFADDTFIVYNSEKAKTIETVINTELKEVIVSLIYVSSNFIFP